MTLVLSEPVFVHSNALLLTLCLHAALETVFNLVPMSKLMYKYFFATQSPFVLLLPPCSYSQLSDSQFEQILSGQTDIEEFVPKETKKEEKK